MENEVQHFTIYSVPGCPWCEKAKELCTEKGDTYTEIILGKDINREEFLSSFPNVRTVPFITINDKTVGGFIELQQRYSS